MNLRMSVLLCFSLATILPAADLTSYRNFRLDASVADVAEQTRLSASDVRVISSRPARVEELDWHVNWASGAASTQSNPFSEVLFRFYNGALFDITVTYDRSQTRGLTDRDMIDAISGVYGKASETVAPEMSFVTPGRMTNTVKVIAGWEDERNQINLVSLPYGSSYGIVISSRANKTLAEQALVESERLDRAEAPQRELDARARQLTETQAADAKARSENKPGFRP